MKPNQSIILRADSTDNEAKVSFRSKSMGKKKGKGNAERRP